MEEEKTTTEQVPQGTPVTVQKNTVMALLSYLGLLIIIPYLVAREDGFVRFHIQQGLVLLVIELIAWCVGFTFWPLMGLVQAVHIATFILAIIGIVNALQGKENELPLVGSYAKHFNIFGS